MIEAIEINRNQFVVRSINPRNGKEFQSATVYDEGSAIRLAHTWNRLYIIETMISWLHQRIIALELGNCFQQKKVAHNLLDIITAGEKTSVDSIAKLITLHQNNIRFIAPAEKSKQYPYYQHTISGIITFCQEKEGQRHD